MRTNTALVNRGKHSKTWVNKTPPSRVKADTIKAHIKETVSIKAWKLVLWISVISFWVYFILTRP